jgi:hypothetical protein
MSKLFIISLFNILVFYSANALCQPADIPDKPKNFTREAEIAGSKLSQIGDEKNTGKHLIINSDSRVDTLIQIHREENIRKGGIDGFRIQIFQGTKDAAYQVKARFISNFENIKVYVLFQAPDFKVRVGDFRTKSEAIKLNHLIKNEFPAGYIVDDIINFPELSGDDKNL